MRLLKSIADPLEDRVRLTCYLTLEVAVDLGSLSKVDKPRHIKWVIKR